MNPITVSTLNTHIVALFDSDELLRDVWVIGEVSNWKRAASGHIYFNMKDDGATINAVMWRGNALTQTWLPREGDQITAHGYVGVYPERGAYQLYVNRIQPAGRGQLYTQFEALKARLVAEGLFSPERKRPLVPVPKRIGIVTSRDAAALRDILRVLVARWPLVDVIVFSVLVQGSDAPGQIVAALATANRYSAEVETLDTLIVARGGGSIEDLWAFNDEGVAYAIAASAIPVVSGIGHETDFTIADFVADLRMPTPSAAAAAVVPDRGEVRSQIAGIVGRMAQLIADRTGIGRRDVDQIERRLSRLHPSRLLDMRRQVLDERERLLRRALRQVLGHKSERNRSAKLRLDALNPLKVLQRGYSVVQRSGGEVVRSPDGLRPDEELWVRAAGGEYQVLVKRSA